MTLDVYNNTLYGFLRLTVGPGSILVESPGVNETTEKTSSLDKFTLGTAKHIVKGTAPASKTRAGTTIRAKPAKRKRK